MLPTVLTLYVKIDNTNPLTYIPHGDLIRENGKIYSRLSVRKIHVQFKSK